MPSPTSYFVRGTIAVEPFWIGHLFLPLGRHGGAGQQRLDPWGTHYGHGAVSQKYPISDIKQALDHLAAHKKIIRCDRDNNPSSSQFSAPTIWLTGFGPKGHRVRACLLPLLHDLHVDPEGIECCHLRG